MRPTSPARGSALLVAIIVVLVLTVIGLAMLRFTRRETAGAFAGEHRAALAACADAARLQLLGQFHALGFELGENQIQPLDTTLGTTGNGGLTTALGGHYDSPPAGIVVEQVSYLPDQAAGPGSSARDLTGISSLIGQGGRPLKIVVMCKDGVDGRELEVEFGIRFGL